MGTSIAVFLLLGAITGAIPIAIYFEICLRVRNTIGLRKPFAEGISIGILVPSIIIAFSLKDAHGESGLAFLMLSPFIGVGGTIAGILMVNIYSKRLARRKTQLR